VQEVVKEIEAAAHDLMAQAQQTPITGMRVDTTPQPAMLTVPGSDLTGDRTPIATLPSTAFEGRTARLSQSGRNQLDQIAAALRTRLSHTPVMTFSIEGHMDDWSNVPSARALSFERAGAVKGYLVQAGISDDSFDGQVGYGSTRPLVPNTNSAGRARNMRVEIIPIARPQGGEPTSGPPSEVVAVSPGVTEGWIGRMPNSGIIYDWVLNRREGEEDRRYLLVYCPETFMETFLKKLPIEVASSLAIWKSGHVKEITDGYGHAIVKGPDVPAGNYADGYYILIRSKGDEDVSGFKAFLRSLRVSGQRRLLDLIRTLHARSAPEDDNQTP